MNAFRALARRYGAEYAYTPMLHAGVASGRTGGGEQYATGVRVENSRRGPFWGSRFTAARGRASVMR